MLRPEWLCRRYAPPVEFGFLSPLGGRVVNAAAARFLRAALVARERPTNQDASRTKPRKSDTLVRTVFRKAIAPLSFAPYRLRLSCTEPQRSRFDFNQNDIGVTLRTCQCSGYPLA